MRIGIDISQIAYQNTGVSNYLTHLVSELVKNRGNEYVLFFSSLRGAIPEQVEKLGAESHVTIKKFKLPPTALHILWNLVHLTPIENFIGPVDLFISSDWAEPPSKKAKKATIIYDMIVYKYPQETHNISELHAKKLRFSSNIVKIQKKKLGWVKKESDIVFCISESTKKDVQEILNIDSSKIKVIYPGISN